MVVMVVTCRQADGDRMEVGVEEADRQECIFCSEASGVELGKEGV